MNKRGLVLFGMILAGSSEAADYECVPEDLQSQRALGILAHVSHFFPTKPIEIARCLVAGGSRYWTAKWAVYEENQTWSKTGSAHCWSDDRQEIPDPFHCEKKITVQEKGSETAITLTHEIDLDRLSEIVDAYRAEFPDDGVVTRVIYKYIEGGGAWRLDQDGYLVSSKNGSHYATKVCGPMPCVWHFDKPPVTNYRSSH